MQLGSIARPRVRVATVEEATTDQHDLGGRLVSSAARGGSAQPPRGAPAACRRECVTAYVAAAGTGGRQRVSPLRSFCARADEVAPWDDGTRTPGAAIGKDADFATLPELGRHLRLPPRRSSATPTTLNAHPFHLIRYFLPTWARLLGYHNWPIGYPAARRSWTPKAPMVPTTPTCRAGRGASGIEQRASAPAAANAWHGKSPNR